MNIGSHNDSWRPINPFILRETVKGYDFSSLSRDAKAGFNVAMLSFPVNMAYAMVAGLPISFGIFSGIVSSLIALFFSRGIYVTLGPSNATAIVLFSSFASLGIATEAGRIAAVPVILALAGLFLIASSLFKLTFLVSYISRTVIVAYITVGALLIAANQMKNMLGFSYPAGEHALSLVDMAVLAFKYGGDAKAGSVCAALITLAIFLPLKKFSKKLPAEGLTLIAMAGVCWLLKNQFEMEIETLDSIGISSWSSSLPDFSGIDFRAASLAAIAISMLCAMEAVSIGKSLASTKADRFDTNQEVFTMGLSNLACSLSSGTLVSGSLTRSTLTVTSGAKTPVYNLFTAIFTLAALLAFGWAVEFVPKASLAMIIVFTSLKLIQPSIIKIALKSTFSDAAVFFATFTIGVVSSLDDAIYAGIGLSVLLFLKKASQPEMVEYSVGDDGELEVIKSNDEPNSEISIVHVEGNMFFGASDAIQNQLRRISAEPHLKILILKLGNAINPDATSVMDLLELSRRMRETGRLLFICEVRPEIMRMLKNSGAYSKMGGRDFVFENDESNPTLSAARAVKAARKFAGSETANVTVYSRKKGM